MKRNALAAVVAGLLFAASVGAACAQPSPRTALAPCPAAPTIAADFVIGQWLYTETITCKAWTAQYDLNQYGTVLGSGCTITGPLPTPGAYGSGHVSAAFDVGGTVVALTGCAVASTSAAQDFAQFSVLCL